MKRATLILTKKDEPEEAGSTGDQATALVVVKKIILPVETWIRNH